MLAGREALPGDHDVLVRFRTQNDFPCADEVEEYVQTSLKWRDETPGTRVKVFFNADNEQRILAVAGYEFLDPDDPSRGVYIAYLGVAFGCHAQGVGSDALRLLLELFRETLPGAPVSWRVHVRNRPSLKMSSRVVPNVEPLYPPEYPGYVEFTVFMPRSAPQEDELPFDDSSD